MRVKKSGHGPVEDPAETEEAGAPEVKHIDALRAVMEFYESAELGDEEENEVDLMIQLSGITYNDMQSED